MKQYTASIQQCYCSSVKMLACIFCHSIPTSNIRLLCLTNTFSPFIRLMKLFWKDKERTRCSCLKGHTNTYFCPQLWYTGSQFDLFPLAELARVTPSERFRIPFFNSTFQIYLTIKFEGGGEKTDHSKKSILSNRLFLTMLLFKRMSRAKAEKHCTTLAWQLACPMKLVCSS